MTEKQITSNVSDLNEALTKIFVYLLLALPVKIWCVEEWFNSIYFKIVLKSIPLRFQRIS